MGGALAEGIIAAGSCHPDAVGVCDVIADAAGELARRTGARMFSSPQTLSEASDVILLCVKPGQVLPVLEEAAPQGSKLFISIAAGVPLGKMEALVSGRHRFIRVMPNTPVLVGKGASAFARGRAATDEDAALAAELLGSVGIAFEVAEDQLDAVTALSGSGPAYVFLLVESLVAAAVDQGLDADLAEALAVQTVSGAARLLEQSGEPPGILRENVTSPNGTTFAALESFRANRFGEIVAEALAAARNRSIELGCAG